MRAVRSDDCTSLQLRLRIADERKRRRSRTQRTAGQSAKSSRFVRHAAHRVEFSVGPATGSPGRSIRPPAMGPSHSRPDQRRWSSRMREYEVMVIFDPDTEERTVQPTLEQAPESHHQGWRHCRQPRYLGPSAAGVRNPEEVRGNLRGDQPDRGTAATSRSWTGSSPSTNQSCGPRSSDLICTEMVEIMHRLPFAGA